MSNESENPKCGSCGALRAGAGVAVPRLPAAPSSRSARAPPAAASIAELNHCAAANLEYKARGAHTSTCNKAERCVANSAEHRSTTSPDRGPTM